MSSSLTAAARSSLDAAGQSDLVVGIPSFNNASTIGHVVRQAADGLAQHFPGQSAVIWNSDGGSTDGTAEAVLGTSLPAGVRSYSYPYAGFPGKGSALLAVFEAAASLGARACVVLDSDLRSVTPEWIARLAGPIVR